METGGSLTKLNNRSIGLVVVLALLALTQVIGLVADVYDTEGGFRASHWDVLQVTGLRLGYVAMILAVLALAAAVLAGRRPEPFTAALLVVSAAPLWGAVPLTDGEGVRGLHVLHLMDEEIGTSLTIAGWIWAVGLYALLLVVLAVALRLTFRLVTGLSDQESRDRVVRPDVLLGALAILTSAVGWFQPIAEMGPDIPDGPRVGVMAVRTGWLPEDAPIFDTILWIVLPAIVVLGILRLAVARGGMQRRWVWVGAAVGGAMVFLSTALIGSKTTNSEELYSTTAKVEPNMTSLMVSLTAVTLFLVAAWLARPTDEPLGDVDGPEPPVSP